MFPGKGRDSRKNTGNEHYLLIYINICAFFSKWQSSMGREMKLLTFLTLTASNYPRRQSATWNFPYFRHEFTFGLNLIFTGPIAAATCYCVVEIRARILEVACCDFSSKFTPLHVTVWTVCSQWFETWSVSWDHVIQESISGKFRNKK